MSDAETASPRARTRLLSAADVGAIDAAAERAGRAGAELMARAGAAIAELARARFPQARTVEVWIGPGKNGGDGWVAARALKAAGLTVAAHALAPPERLQGDARAAYDAWRAAGGDWRMLEAPESGAAIKADLVIDALFGVGLSRPLAGAAREALLRLGAPGAPPVLAVDMPSGVAADTGAILGAAAPAQVTGTFLAPKRGLALGPGAAAAGDVVVLDILRDDPAGALAWAAVSQDVFEITPDSFGRGALGDGLQKSAWRGHKFAYGHLRVATGGLGATGAARLAARAARRVGAGLVTLAAPSSALPECAGLITGDMLRRADAPSAFVADLEADRVGALLLGPAHASHPSVADRTRRPAAARPASLSGAGRSRRPTGWGRTAQTVLAALAAEDALGRPVSVVLDADALSCWGGAPERLFDAAARCETPPVLTPHLGEFARLFPDLAARLEGGDDAAFGKIEATRLAAARASCVVLLKGADTVAAAPDGRVGVNAAFGARAAPWLATAGAGDVLAGIIAGLAARGWAPFDAACAGAWLHVEAARRFGPGLIAEDLSETLPAVLRDVAAPARA